MKLKAILILILIVASLVPAYSLNKYLQKLLKPGESLQRLALYMLLTMLLIFAYTFVLVLVINWLFPQA